VIQYLAAHPLPAIVFLGALGFLYYVFLDHILSRPMRSRSDLDNSNDRPKSIMFKRVTGGWVYRASTPWVLNDAAYYLASTPWVFGDAPHYLVNDAQKAQIEAIIIPRRPVLLGAIVLGGGFAWVLAVEALLGFFSEQSGPSSRDMVALFALTIFPLLAAVLAAGWIQRRRLQPVLAGLPLTQERITAAEIRENARTATPYKRARNAYIAFLFACFAAIGAAVSHFVAKPHLDSLTVLWIFISVLLGRLAFVWNRRALRKAAETPAEADTSKAARFVRLSRDVLLIAVSGLVIVIAGLQILHKSPVPPSRGRAPAASETFAAPKLGPPLGMRVTTAPNTGVHDHFGAIAYSPSSRAHGYSFDSSTQADAEARAVAECNSKGEGCKSTTWFKNGCGALAVGPSGWGSDWGQDQQTAEQKALDKCKNHSSDCSVVRWVCTTR